MPEELDKTAISKITRDVIYRQRVFGTNCGKSDFIKVDDTRKLSRLGLVIYVVFIAFTLQFTFDRIRITDAFMVNIAIHKALTKAPFKLEPEPKYWDDLTTTEDLQSWLVSAFPTIITPAVKSFIYPLGYVRFTVRRIEAMDNPDPRFQALAPSVWLEKSGVPPSSASVESDNQEPFGEWRVWGSNLRKVTDPQGPILRNGKKVNGLAWCTKRQARCPVDAELLDVLHVPEALAGAGVEATCREWCSDMPRCRCVTQRIDTDTCEFYYTERLYPVNLTAAANNEADYSTISCEGDDLRQRILEEPSTLLPHVQYENPQGRDFVVHYPWMRRFTFQNSNQGWRNTPGFVFKLMYWSEADVSAYLEETVRDGPDLGVGMMPTQVNIVANPLREWVEGGLFSWGTSSITLDFVTYNPHYEIYSHVTLTFRLEASGTITKSIGLTSLNINKKGPVASDPMDDFQDFTSMVYLVFIGLYILGELWELGSKCRKYFMFAWNWLTMAQLVLHVAVVVVRYFYLQDEEFAKQIEGEFATDITTSFSNKAVTYEYFVWVSALNLLFVFFQLLHYLNDTFPRVRVLVDTMVRAMTPIIFLVIVIADAFFGFVFWSNLMYGKSVSSFNNMGAAATACTELLFGQVDAYFELREAYPLSGSLFFILYMMIFYFVLQNVSKAVVLVSYDDACDGYDGIMQKEAERNRARMSGHSDSFTRYWKHFQKKAVNWIAGDKKNRSKENKIFERYKTSSAQVVLFAVFSTCYTIMAYWMVQVSWSNQMSASMRTAISVPIFETTHPATGEISRDNTFDTITTRDDVKAWISQVLPQVMFNTSAGTLDREENPLKLYDAALPEAKFTQLVINNWNIMLGQLPVRITTKYFAQRDDFSIGSFRIPRQVRSVIEDQGRTFIPAGNFTESPNNAKTLAVLERHCNHTDAYGSMRKGDENGVGFACMLGVNYTETLEVLASFAENDFIMEQTAVVAIDFVVYNGYSDSFLYVALTFEFQPSGMIYTGLITKTVRLTQYAGDLVYRIILEVLVTIFSLFYIRLSFIGMFRAVKSDLAADTHTDRKTKSLWHLIIAVRAIFRFLVLDPFNLLDFVSSIATVYTMSAWFALTNSDLAKRYFFPPSPRWDPASCATPWCSDDDVINYFYRESKMIEEFTQVCAMNTVMVFFRLLKYLQGFPSMAIMFKTFGRAVKDLSWFLIMMLVLLMGYVCLGFHLFGMRSSGFQSIGTSLVACFEMFLGTFRYRELRDSDPLAYFFFSITYIILFKYMIINMFFAIVDKHYHREILSPQYKSLEDEKRPLGERISENLKTFLGKVKVKDLVMKGRSMSMATIVSSVGTPSPRDYDHPDSPRHSEMSEQRPDSPWSAGTRLASPTALTAHSSSSIESGMKAKDEGGLLPKPDLTASQNCRNWHSLPPETQKWALEESFRINEFVVEQKERRHESESVKDELDLIHVQAEQELQQRSREARQEAEIKLEGLRKHELLRLKEIHQDQESLSWYIMKRQAELKNLEAIKKTKQERFDKMVKAATTLITSGEEEAEANQEQ